MCGIRVQGSGRPFLWSPSALLTIREELPESSKAEPRGEPDLHPAPFKRTRTFAYDDAGTLVEQN